jgi:hypothetical protein
LTALLVGAELVLDERPEVLECPASVNEVRKLLSGTRILAKISSQGSILLVFVSAPGGATDQQLLQPLGLSEKLVRHGLSGS